MTILPRTPDLVSQRAAMQKLSFLVGSWSGHARLLRTSGEFVELHQTEEARYKLNGLVLLVEGIGRATSSGEPLLQAIGFISYDDETGAYRMRAFNEGRFLETQLALLPERKGMTWGFALGDIRTRSVLRINENGAWTELAEITIGSQPPKTLLDLIVYPQP